MDMTFLRTPRPGRQTHLITGLVTVGALISAAWTSSSVQQRTPAPAPAHVVENWQSLIGTWIASNQQYKSDLDPMDAYGITWEWGLNKKSLVGRLYGLRDGKEVGTFWEFREFWHPGEHRVIATQFGRDGTYGVGPHDIGSDGTSEMLQTFFAPEEGAIRKIGHRAHLKGDVHTTSSFDVNDQDDWKPRRSYVWRRQR
jgi:hypothetical protein